MRVRPLLLLLLTMGLTALCACDDGQSGSASDANMADVEVDDMFVEPVIDVCGERGPPCHGDPTGTWRMAEACALPAGEGAADITINECEALDGRVSIPDQNLSVIVFDTDGTSDGAAQASLRFVGTFPFRCLASDECSSNCEEVRGVGCRCALTQGFGGVSGDTWAVEDGVINLTGEFSSTEVEYCVSGGELSLVVDMFGAPIRLRFERAVGEDWSLSARPKLVHLLEGSQALTALVDGQPAGIVDGYGVAEDLETVSVGAVDVELSADGLPILARTIETGRRGRSLRWIAWGTAANPNLTRLTGGRVFFNAYTEPVRVNRHDGRGRVESASSLLEPGQALDLAGVAAQAFDHVGVDIDLDGVEDAIFSLTNEDPLAFVSDNEGPRLRLLREDDPSWIRPIPVDQGGAVTVMNFRMVAIQVREAGVELEIPAKEARRLPVGLGRRVIEILEDGAWVPAGTMFTGQRTEGWLVAHDNGPSLHAVGALPRVFHLAPELGDIDIYSFERLSERSDIVQAAALDVAPLTWVGLAEGEAGGFVVLSDAIEQPITRHSRDTLRLPGIFVLPGEDGAAQLWHRAGETFLKLNEGPYAQPLLRLALPPVEAQAEAVVRLDDRQLGPAPLGGVSAPFDVGFEIGGDLTVQVGDDVVAEVRGMSLHLNQSTIYAFDAANAERSSLHLVPSKSRGFQDLSMRTVAIGMPRAQHAVARVDCATDPVRTDDWRDFREDDVPRVICLDRDRDGDYERSFAFEPGAYAEQSVMVMFQVDANNEAIATLIPYDGPAIRLESVAPHTRFDVTHVAEGWGPVTLEVDGVPTTVIALDSGGHTILTASEEHTVRLLHDNDVVWSRTWTPTPNTLYGVVLRGDQHDMPVIELAQSDEQSVRVLNLTGTAVRTWVTGAHPDGLASVLDLFPAGVVEAGASGSARLVRQGSRIVVDVPDTAGFDMQAFNTIQPPAVLILEDGPDGISKRYGVDGGVWDVQPGRSAWVRIISVLENDLRETTYAPRFGATVERRLDARRAYGYQRTEPGTFRFSPSRGITLRHPVEPRMTYTGVLDRVDGEYQMSWFESLDMITAEPAAWALYNRTGSAIRIIDEAGEPGDMIESSDLHRSATLPNCLLDVNGDDIADVRFDVPNADGFQFIIFEAADTPTGYGATVLSGLIDVVPLVVEAVEP